MKSLFLLFVALIMILVLKEVPKKEKIQRLDIVRSQVLDFSGTLFVPKTLQADQQLVNSSFIIITVAGKKYRYVKCFNSFCLSGTAEEVPVNVGDKIDVSFPTKLFFAREL